MASATHSNGRVAVIGAGMAGLACAVSLAAAGREVLLLEKGMVPGGKMRLVEASGASMDGGPTVFTMRYVFEQLFERAGASLSDYVKLREAAILARHFWPDGGRLDLHADRSSSARAIRDFAGSSESEGYVRFCRDAGHVFAALKDSFIAGQRPNPFELALRIGRRNPADLARLRPFSTLWQALGGYFRDPRLRQLFGRYATYVGSSPFAAPATLMLIAHVEQEGVWLVDGGMHALALAMAGLARQKGVDIRHGCEVTQIIPENGGYWVITAGAERHWAREVVWCGDVSALAGCLGSASSEAPKPVAQRNRSLSAMVWAMRAQVQGVPLARHTVFFSDDYKAEFDAIFGRGALPEVPTIYVCAHDRSDSGAGGATGTERLYMLVNAPANGDMGSISAGGMEKCLESAWRQMARCGLKVDPQGPITLTGPREWNALFPATGGALYGRASHGWTASFARPGAQSRLPGLYLAGGSVHPGPGVPMAAMSGMLAADRLLQRHRSMRS
jgi:1-hydroxycarotenoid 3,4-desaturase